MPGVKQVVSSAGGFDRCQVRREVALSVTYAPGPEPRSLEDARCMVVCLSTHALQCALRTPDSCETVTRPATRLVCTRQPAVLRSSWQSRACTSTYCLAWWVLPCCHVADLSVFFVCRCRCLNACLVAKSHSSRFRSPSDQALFKAGGQMGRSVLPYGLAFVSTCLVLLTTR